MATQIRHALFEGNFRGVSNFALIHRCAQDWANHFSYAVNFVEQNGGVAHLYFHSWEIEERGHWRKLESLLKYVAERNDLVRVTNGEIFRRWHAKSAGAIDRPI